MLFSSGTIYKTLFNPSTDALALARSVQIVRAVDQILDEIQGASDGVEAGVAIHGRRVIAHIILQEIGDTALRDPAFDFDAVLGAAPQKAVDHAKSLVSVFPENSYPGGNVFKNQARLHRPAVRYGAHVGGAAREMSSHRFSVGAIVKKLCARPRR